MPKTTPALALLGGPRAVTDPFPPYPIIGQEEVFAATQVLMSRTLSDPGRGPVIAAFENAYADFFGTKYCLSLSSGTAAIHCALFAVGVKPGTEVLTCAHTWISAIMAILHAGGTPVFCDVKPGCWHLSAEEIKRKATPHTKAVIVTHLWGFPADMGPIMKVCRELKLAVVEDTSHAHGAKYKGKYCGTFGECGAFSLQGSKAIVAGEGGFMLTDSELLFQRGQIPGHHGARLNAAMTLEGVKAFGPAGGAWTYRMSPLAAAIATEQLKRLPALNAARQANFDRLYARLRAYSCIRWPRLDKGSVRGWYGTPACFDAAQAGISRDTFVQACRAEGAGIGGEGYMDYTQVPLFQDLDLYAQMFVPRHANGVAFKPLKPTDLPHYQQLRAAMLMLPVPAQESPRLMDQIADGVDKVMANLPALTEWEKAQAKAQK